jgi:hypothetical protein
MSVDEKIRKELFLTLALFQVEVHQLTAKVHAVENLIKQHPELYGEFQKYENERRQQLQNPQPSTTLDVSLEALRNSLLP